jgi:hypothetical protein
LLIVNCLLFVCLFVCLFFDCWVLLWWWFNEILKFQRSTSLFISEWGTPNVTLAHIAARQGHLHILQFLDNLTHDLPKNLEFVASIHGRVDILKWLHDVLFRFQIFCLIFNFFLFWFEWSKQFSMKSRHFEFIIKISFTLKICLFDKYLLIDLWKNLSFLFCFVIFSSQKHDSVWKVIWSQATTHIFFSKDSISFEYGNDQRNTYWRPFCYNNKTIKCRHSSNSKIQINTFIRSKFFFDICLSFTFLNWHLSLDELYIEELSSILPFLKEREDEEYWGHIEHFITEDGVNALLNYAISTF